MKIAPLWRWQRTCFVLKTSTNHLRRKRYPMWFTHETDIQRGRWTLFRLRKRAVRGGLALHTCMCLDGLPMQWC